MRALRPAVVLTMALFLATGIGVPVHHHADHDGDRAHLTAGDHGHGATLLARDMRTERRGTSADVPVAVPIARRSHPSVPVDRVQELRSRVHVTGRSPPPQLLPRAPPPSS